MKTFVLKPKDVTRQWFIVDASEVPLGRLATSIASLLLGKGKTTTTAHVDGGDYVVVINSDQLKVSASKKQTKIYYRHSGFPGGIKQRTLEEVVSKDSRQAVIKAVRGMLPDNKLRASRLSRLKVYKDDQHNHNAQQPTAISLNKDDQ